MTFTKFDILTGKCKLEDGTILQIYIYQSRAGGIMLEVNGDKHYLTNPENTMDLYSLDIDQKLFSKFYKRKKDKTNYSCPIGHTGERKI